MRLQSIFIALLTIVLGQSNLPAQETPRGDQPATTPRRGNRGAVDNRPYGPAELPGKGLAQHPFLYAGEAPKLNVFIVRDGKVDWSYTHPGRGEISDASMLSNGNVLIAYQFGVAVVSPDKNVVWEYKAPAGVEIHTASPMGTDRVMFVQNGDPAKLVVMKVADSTVEKEFNLPTANAKNTHVQFRHARVTKNGTFLVAHMDSNKVSEYDDAGKQIWSVEAASPWSAARLKNGNTLIVGNRNYVREVNPASETVWELVQADVPEIRLFNTQTAQRLANGNTLVTNWRSPANGQFPIQAIEVTPEKKLVWALRSWEDPANLGPASNLQVLDEVGAAEKMELER